MASRSRPSAVPLFQSLLLLASISAVSALPVALPQSETLSPTTNTVTVINTTDPSAGLLASSHIAGTCGFEGNPDVYGLGIRIGLYTQWLSTMISNWLVTNTVSQSVNTCFQLVMLIAVIAMSIQDPKPHAIDVYLIIAQIVGSLCTTSAHNVRQTACETHSSEKKPTNWGSVVRFLIYWAVAAYSTFFWFNGYQYVQPLEPGCEPIAWLFIKVPFFGWYQTLLEIVSAIAFGTFCLLFIYFLYTRGSQMINDSFIGMWRKAREKKRLRAQSQESDIKPRLVARATDESANDPYNAHHTILHHTWTPISCLILFICAVAAIESMIIWNGIIGVEEVFSTGQLIPLVTGVGGLLSELYQIWDKPKVWSLVIEKKRMAKEMLSAMVPTTNTEEPVQDVEDQIPPTKEQASSLEQASGVEDEVSSPKERVEEKVSSPKERVEETKDDASSSGIAEITDAHSDAEAGTR